MNKTKIIVITCGCIVFAAGVFAGVAATELKPKQAAHAPDRLERNREQERSSLRHDLDLTAEQHREMRRIWSDVVRLGNEHREKTAALREQREQAIRGLFTPEQLARYEEVLRENSKAMGEINAARKRAFDEAVEQTKQILNEDQREKYEELLKSRSGSPMMPAGRRTQRQSNRSQTDMTPRNGE